MKFKRIYIEITNICNLNCSFCSKSNRKKKEMTSYEFEEILKKINKYTDYIYLHVKGEPLIHKELDSILSLCKKYNKKVCITTNGVFLKKRIDVLSKYDNIYQINISLHSENNKTNYLDDIFEAVDKLEYPYISYRFWTLDKGIMNDKLSNYLDRIKDKYNVTDVYSGMKLDNKIYISLDDKFEWPNLNSDYINDNGYCYGGKTQLAILNDGTVSVCCLDADGISDLGNIFDSDMEDIINSDEYKNIIDNFSNRKAYLDICKHCKYKHKFDK